jgi:hypothetical protein
MSQRGLESTGTDAKLRTADPGSTAYSVPAAGEGGLGHAQGQVLGLLMDRQGGYFLRVVLPVRELCGEVLSSVVLFPFPHSSHTRRVLLVLANHFWGQNL